MLCDDRNLEANKQLIQLIHRTQVFPCVDAGSPEGIYQELVLVIMGSYIHQVHCRDQETCKLGVCAHKQAPMQDL